LLNNTEFPPKEKWVHGGECNGFALNRKGTGGGGKGGLGGWPRWEDPGHEVGGIEIGSGHLGKEGSCNGGPSGEGGPNVRKVGNLVQGKRVLLRKKKRGSCHLDVG